MAIGQNFLNKFSTWRTPFFEFSALGFAGFIYATALKYFVFPAHIILTGTEGIAVSSSYFLENYWVFVGLYAVFQSALLTFSAFKLGRSFTLRTLGVVAIILLLLFVFPDFQFAKPEAENEKLILVLFGGLLAGIAKAMALKNGGSVGDEDVMTAYIGQKLTLPVGKVVIFAGVISTVFGLSLLFVKTRAFGDVVNVLMYTSVYLFVCKETLDIWFKRYDLCKVMIITKVPDTVIPILSDFSSRRTYTLEDASGGYSKASQSIISILVTAEELPILMQLFKSRSVDAFIYHHKIEGVLGNYHFDPIAR